MTHTFTIPKRQYKLSRMSLLVALLAVAVIVVASVLLMSAKTSAQAVPASSTANVLKVSPVRSDIEVNPGETKTVQTTVTNLTGAAISVSAIENDFISGDENGTPALILDASKSAPTHSLKRFLTPIPDITIPAGQSKTINVVVTVPKDAQAGGYFGAIRFAPTSPDGGGQVNLSASVASLILLRVSGTTVEKLDLTNFDIQQNGVTGSKFSTPDNLKAFVRFQNKGNVQLGPFGKISVKQGDKVIYDTDFNVTEPRDVILPDGARRWEVPLKNVGAFGFYTVVATLTYGQKNQSIEVSQSFWVIPQIVVIVGLVVAGLLLAALIVGIILIIRSRRNRRLRGRGIRR